MGVSKKKLEVWLKPGQETVSFKGPPMRKEGKVIGGEKGILGCWGARGRGGTLRGGGQGWGP